VIDPALHKAFPKLKPGNHSFTSPFDPRYNCIAWAAGDTQRFWWPVQGSPYYWPPGICREVRRECFIDAFKTLGYEVLPDADTTLNSQVEKVALYEKPNGEPTHAARQLPTGEWTSKLGLHVDISHSEVTDVEGPAYGTVSTILFRPRPTLFNPKPGS
jgi:hypothetical protein